METQKDTIEYKDKIGREIKMGHHVAIARGTNMISLAKVVKFTAKQIKVEALRGSQWYYLYPHDCLVLDSEDMLVYLLKL